MRYYAIPRRRNTFRIAQDLAMPLRRRRFLHLTAAALATPALPRAAFALDYPARPVRILVGYSAGGVSDILARLLAQKLSDRLGQPFVVEDRPGAAQQRRRRRRGARAARRLHVVSRRHLQRHQCGDLQTSISASPAT